METRGGRAEGEEPSASGSRRKEEDGDAEEAEQEAAAGSPPSPTPSLSSSPPPPPPPPPPAGLTREEYEELRGVIEEHHTYLVAAGQCSSLLSQRVRAPAAAVWSVVRRFDRPQVYKHFIRSCSLKDDGGGIRVGCLRELIVISGLPASTSTERLDVLDEDRHVAGFSIIGGEHRLRNYRSVTTVNEFRRPDPDPDRDRGGDGEIWSVVLESYVVDVPEGNTEEDTRLFADTVVRLNLQKLASVSEAIASGRAGAIDLDDGEEEEEPLHSKRAKKKRAGSGN